MIDTMQQYMCIICLSFGLVWFGLCRLMTPGLRKDIRCHV